MRGLPCFFYWYGPDPVETSESIRRVCMTCNRHIKCGPTGGVRAASPIPKSVSFLRKRKRSTVDGFVIAYLSSVELLSIYHR